MEVQVYNRRCNIDIYINKKKLISKESCMSQNFYEDEKETASNLIALSIMRELFENNLLTDKEFAYLVNTYGLLN